MENNINWHQLHKDILDNLSNGYKPLELSKLLGYNYNAFDRWYSKKARFAWSDFYNLSRVVNLGLSQKMNKLFSFNSNIETGSALLSQVFINRNFKKVIFEMPVSKQTLSKWIHGQVKLPFISALKILSIELGFLDFLSFLTGGVSPQVNRIEKTRKKYLKLHREYPFIGTMLRLTENDSIGFDCEKISKSVGENICNVRRALQLAIDAQIVFCVGNSCKVSPMVEMFYTGEIKEFLYSY